MLKRFRPFQGMPAFRAARGASVEEEASGAANSIFPLEHGPGAAASEPIPLPAMDVPLFMDMAPVAICLVSLSGTIIDANQAAAELYGVTSRFELLGHRVDHFIDPRERETASRSLAAVLEQGTKAHQEYVCRRKDGRTFDALVSTRLVRGAAGEPAAFLVVTQDISARKAHERALAESETRFRTLFETANDGVFLVDEEARIVTVNRRGGELLGLAPEKIVGRKAVEFLTGGVKDHVQARFEALRRGDAVPSMEQLLRRADGTEIAVEIRGALVKDGEGRPFGVQYVVRDLTERKSAEGERAKVADQLRRALGNIINVVAATVEMRDPGTAGHQKRVANVARAIGSELGLGAESIEAIRFAGVVHDVGKTSVPAEILSKPGRLSEDELRLVREHARFGYEILKNVEFPWPIAEIVLQHHEREDGSGYPRGLKGSEILIEAKIIGVADVIEAMASHRPYRPALGIEKALAELTAQRGRLYDAAVVDACLKVFAERKVPLL
jgi:PAS domain S-box-containing protein/putative nucleotidyltransferase with HDIG domain